MANGNRTSSVGNGTLLTVVVVVAVLYFARVVFIPLALAVLVAFLLAPLVNRLRHWRLGRILSVIIVVLFSFIVVGIISAVMASQMTELGRKLPEYQENVRQKLHAISTSGGGLINQITRVAQNFAEELTPASAKPSSRS